MRDVIESICSFSAIFVALISLHGVFRKSKSDEKIKMIEIQENRKLDALKEFLEHSDMYTSSTMSGKSFLGYFSHVMMYLDDEQRETALRAKRYVQEDNREGAEREIETLCAMLHDQIFEANMKRTSKGTKTKIAKR